MEKWFFIFFGSVFYVFTACTSMEQKKNLKTAEEFFETCAERKDVKKLMSFYSSLDPKWEDAVSRSIWEGKENIENKYTDSWSFKDYKNQKTLQINEMFANDSVVAVSGQYNPYYYNGKKIQEMKFTTWLYFDKEGKIKRQVEWIQYSPEDLKDIINFSQNAEIR